jgi:hypothetical protein
MIQHDMMMWDHGMPRADGTWNREQRPEADVNIEFQSTALARGRGDEAPPSSSAPRTRSTRPTIRPRWGPHMTNTDSTPFMNITHVDLAPEERARVAHRRGGGTRPGTQPIDVFTTFSDKDFRLGLNAAQTTLGAVAQLAGGPAAVVGAAPGGAEKWNRSCALRSGEASEVPGPEFFFERSDMFAVRLDRRGQRC